MKALIKKGTEDNPVWGTFLFTNGENEPTESHLPMLFEGNASKNVLRTKKGLVEWTFEMWDERWGDYELVDVEVTVKKQEGLLEELEKVWSPDPPAILKSSITTMQSGTIPDGVYDVKDEELGIDQKMEFRNGVGVPVDDSADEIAANQARMKRTYAKNMESVYNQEGTVENLSSDRSSGELDRKEGAKGYCRKAAVGRTSQMAPSGNAKGSTARGH